VAEGVRWPPPRSGEAAQGARAREPAAEEAGGGPSPRQRDPQRGGLGKLLSPPRRRQAVLQVRQRLPISERRACRVLGPGADDAAVSTDERGRRGPPSRPARRARDAVWPVWVSPGHGGVTGGRLAGESQTGGPAVAARRLESAAETAETRATVAPGWVMCPPSGGVSASRVGV
jgi:hypothetical protein